MRIAIDASRSATDSVTGTQRYSQEIIPAIADLSKCLALTLYTRGRSEQLPAGPNIEHIRIDRKRLWTHIGLSQALRSNPPTALFVPSHVIPALHPEVSVVTIHDLGYLQCPDAHPYRQRLMLEAATRWNVHAATRVIAISEQTRRDLIDRYGASGEQIDVVYHGIDHQQFRQLEPDIVNNRLEQLGLARQSYILFVSTLHPRKNLIRLIEAFERMQERDLTLVIAGRPGWDVVPILRRIGLSPASGRIAVLGHVSESDLPILYNGAAMFVLPSLYEGFGLGIVEAMACGCPVVTSDRSSMPEIAGDAAVLVDPESTDSIMHGMQRALAAATRDSLIQRGLDRAAAFTWDSAARQTLSTIQRAVRDHHA